MNVLLFNLKINTPVLSCCKVCNSCFMWYVLHVPIGTMDTFDI